MIAYFWNRFLWLGWIAKALVVAGLLYAMGWVAGTLGLDGMARDLGETALYIAAFPVTALIISGLWRHSTAHHRR